MESLSEKNGKSSSIRQCMFICVLGAVAMGLLGVWKGVDLIGLAALVSPFVGFSMGFKAYQKGKETE